jgi:acetylglutamate kinase
MSPEIFAKIAERSLDLIPKDFKEKIQNTEIIIEDFPDWDMLNDLGISSRWELLGLYVGVPITNQSFFSTAPLPERIYLFRKPILRAAGSPENIPSVIRDVLIHEIGHHLGFSDSELSKMNI